MSISFSSKSWKLFINKTVTDRGKMFPFNQNVYQYVHDSCFKKFVFEFIELSLINELSVKKKKRQYLT